DERWGMGDGESQTPHPSHPIPDRSHPIPDSAFLVPRLCENFARNGISALAAEPSAPWLHRYILNRWDELQLRVMLHGFYAPT
ncbi:MAG TPA: hypothetical protein VJ865_03110, partial [Gemmatimonadaceae bacterium]|nr:hypothetical protein [Gemmatimonadaceae bacterium]